MKRKPYRGPNQILIALRLTKYALLSAVRSKGNLFFSLAFPLAFVFLFGSFGNTTYTVRVGVADSLDTKGGFYEALKGVSEGNNAAVTLTIGPVAELEAKLAKSDLDGVLEPSSDGSTVKLVTTGANASGKGASMSIFQGIVGQLNYDAAQQAAGPTFKPPYAIQLSDIAGRTYRYIDYILPGQIGFSILSLATFGIAYAFITLRKTLVFKRMLATSARPITFVISQCLSRAIQAVVQAAIIIGAGVYFFDFSLPYGWVTLGAMLLISFVGILAFLGFGILLSNLANENSAPAILNLFNLPQMLLAGVFFSTEGLPVWLQRIGNNLPLAYITTALRKVSLENAPLTSLTPYLLGLLAWSAAAYVLAALTFRTEE